MRELSGCLGHHSWLGLGRALCGARSNTIPKLLFQFSAEARGSAAEEKLSRGGRYHQQETGDPECASVVAINQGNGEGREEGSTTAHVLVDIGGGSGPSTDATIATRRKSHGVRYPMDTSQRSFEGRRQLKRPLLLLELAL